MPLTDRQPAIFPLSHLIEAGLEAGPGAVSLQRLPATGAALLPEPIVLLHGWGCNREIWRPLAAELNSFAEVWLVDLPGFGDSAGVSDYSLVPLIERLLQALPERAVYLGWSLGGMLATALAARHPTRVSGLITLAANLAFVVRDDWAQAMPRRTFDQFCRGFEASPAAALKRFTALEAQGDARERVVLRWLRRNQAEPAPVNTHWRDALRLLADIDNRRAFASLTLPGLHMLGQADALVPSALARAMRDINGSQQVVVLPSVGHAIPVSEPRRIADLVREFLLGKDFWQRERYDLDKRKVAQSFSRAAPTYDSVAELQRRVGERLLSRLPVGGEFAGGEEEPGTLLDLGCGTGYFCQRLKARFPRADIIGLDIAEGMLRYARRQRPDADLWLCGDAETLPLAENSVDLVFSSLTIQWCRQLPRLLTELKRVLKPGGQLLCTTLGPDTLKELRAAWRSVDEFAHVNQFVPQASVQRDLLCAGFNSVEWEAEHRVLHYRELAELTRELKALGAHNVNAGRSAGLTGRKRVQAFKSAYEQFRSGGALPATYEIYYCRSEA